MTTLTTLRHPTARYPQRKLTDITHVIVHHSATPHDSQGPEEWANWHVNGHGWAGIAYTYCVMPNGTVYQTTRLQDVGYHCKGRNTVSASICLAGHFDKHDPTEDQLEATAKLIVEINRTIGRRLLIDWHDHHRPTSCPGKFFPRKDLEKRVADIYAPTPPVVVVEDDYDDVGAEEPETDNPLTWEDQAKHPTMPLGCVWLLMPLLACALLLIILPNA